MLLLIGKIIERTNHFCGLSTDNWLKLQRHPQFAGIGRSFIEIADHLKIREGMLEAQNTASLTCTAPRTEPELQS